MPAFLIHLPLLTVHPTTPLLYILTSFIAGGGAMLMYNIVLRWKRGQVEDTELINRITQQTIDGTDDLLQQYRIEVEVIKRQIDDYRVQLYDMTKQLTSATIRIANLESELSTAKKNRAALEEELSDVKRDRERLQEEIKRVTERIITLERGATLSV